ncbi:MAG TPA: 3-phosphoshikimate 1-carboxyvinyltransferase [Bacteroidales bacterium]|nr:3-phosphoshikimate 1-carboxyvinyltransferase [Bacteroidales bacterium]
MNYVLNYSKDSLSLTVDLPASKSISNRMLIIRALTENNFEIKNISDSDDTNVMLKAFAEDKEIVDIHHAGTSMRFLTAYFAATGQKKTITGSDRMKNRPIKELVNALNQLGANVTYAEKEGYPPVITSGKALTGDRITINGSISSQYITALLLVAPVLPNGLNVEIVGKLMSSSYVALTLGLMKQFGVNASWEGNVIRVPHQKYLGNEAFVEGDWSGASYWYEMVALSKEADITINGLTGNSLQGDSALANIYEGLGVKTSYKSNAVRLTKCAVIAKKLEYDFIDNPDSVQTAVVTSCLLGIPFTITGAETLRIKETDRIAALQIEMKKLGFIIEEPRPGTLSWEGQTCEPQKQIAIDTYKDHRMALAFAPAAMRFKNLTINDAMVVTKSYPKYWEHLEMAGFEIDERDGAKTL